MKWVIILTAGLLTGCATTVAVVDTTASTAIYATKGVVSTTYDIITWPFSDDE